MRSESWTPEGHHPRDPPPSRWERYRAGRKHTRGNKCKHKRVSRIHMDISYVPYERSHYYGDTHHCSVGEQIGPFDILLALTPNSAALEDRGDRWKPGHRKNVWFFFRPNQHISCAAHRVPRPHPVQFHADHTHLGNVLREVVVPLAQLPRCSHRSLLSCVEKWDRSDEGSCCMSNLPAGR